MAVTATPIFIQTPQSFGVQIQNSDSTNKKTIYTAGANGSVIESLFVTSTDTADEDVILYVNDGTTDFQIGRIKVPLNSGNTNAVPTLDLMRHSQLPFFESDNAGNRVLKLKASHILKVAAAAAITSGKFLNFFGTGGDF